MIASNSGCLRPAADSHNGWAAVAHSAYAGYRYWWGPLPQPAWLNDWQVDMASTGVPSPHEQALIDSLANGSSRNETLLAAIHPRLCWDSSMDCYLTMLAASNLLLHSGDLDSGLRGALQAHEKVRGDTLCPIAFEATLLHYKLNSLTTPTDRSPRARARALVRNITRKGGLSEDLRRSACTEALKSNPSLLQAYERQFVDLLTLANN